MQTQFDCLVTGIVYDFMGWLTSQPNKITLSSSDDAVPAANAVNEFLTVRGIDSNNDEMIHVWPLLRNRLRIEDPCSLPR